jgi:hypothetical protein
MTWCIDSSMYTGEAGEMCQHPDPRAAGVAVREWRSTCYHAPRSCQVCWTSLTNIGIIIVLWLLGPRPIDCAPITRTNSTKTPCYKLIHDFLETWLRRETSKHLKNDMFLLYEADWQKLQRKTFRFKSFVVMKHTICHNYNNCSCDLLQHYSHWLASATHTQKSCHM